MKNLFLIVALIINYASFSQRKSSSDISVKGYYRDNGTYVAPHYRTSPNSTNRDNFSTIGNINPYTGERGTIKPDNNSNGNSYINNNETTFETYTMPSTVIEEYDYNIADAKLWKSYYRDGKKKLLDDKNELINRCKTQYHSKGKHFEKTNGKMILVNNKNNFNCDFCSQTNEMYLYNFKQWQNAETYWLSKTTSVKHSDKSHYTDLSKEINYSNQTSFYDLNNSLELKYISFTVVNDKAYFYHSPNLENRSKAYLIIGEKSKIYSSSGDFVYTKFQNASDKITKGWIRLSDIIRE